MAHINTARVRGKMAERGYNTTSIARELEIDRNTFANYLKVPEKMPFGIMERLARLLCSDREEALGIFLRRTYAKRKNREEKQMTRMERKRTRSCTLDLVIGALCVGMLVGGLLPPFDAEDFKTLLAVIGAVATGVCFVRFVVWLDR